MLLVHDLLLTKRGISAPAPHPLRLAAERHKARLHAEFKKARLRKGFTSIEDLRASVEEGNTWLDNGTGKINITGNCGNAEAAHAIQPRWVRINTLKTTLDDQLRTTFAGYKKLESLEQLTGGDIEPLSKRLYVDHNIPNLLALPSATQLAKTPAYLNGFIILQDKASCFSAYLLDPDPEDGDIIDACAAPGNKTTHVAAIVNEKDGAAQKPKIYACERDSARAATLDKMIRTAGANNWVTMKGRQDFLRTDPTRAPWSNVGSLLLDPSCSGSGIIGRDETLKVLLPSKQPIDQPKSHSKKRKRKTKPDPPLEIQEVQEEVPISEDKSLEQLIARLTALSTFQLKLLLHAFQFPKARKVTYSTCSIYAEENEHVVLKALESSIATDRGWRILRRIEQVPGMKAWNVRGDAQACNVIAAGARSEEIAEACIRCEKGTQEGTQGFFVAAFVRDGSDGVNGQLLEEEWEGFSDNRGDK